MLWETEVQECPCESLRSNIGQILIFFGSFLWHLAQSWRKHCKSCNTLQHGLKIDIYCCKNKFFLALRTGPPPLPRVTEQHPGSPLLNNVSGTHSFGLYALTIPYFQTWRTYTPKFYSPQCVLHLMPLDWWQSVLFFSGLSLVFPLGSARFPSEPPWWPTWNARVDTMIRRIPYGEPYLRHWCDNYRL